LGTFNAENLFLRYKLLDNEKGSRKPKPVDPEKFLAEGGSIFVLGYAVEDVSVIGDAQRKSTAKVILANEPDVVALQEVENMEALKQFNRRYLKRAYPYQMLIDANDPRLIDVAVLSRLPIVHVRTHQFDPDEEGDLIFSRDCLEVDVQAPSGEVLTLFVNHFKSQIGGGGERRLKQAKRVAEIVQERFGNDLRGGDFAVVGDLNSGPETPELAPLLGLPGLENVIQTRLPEAERWTHAYRKVIQQLDYMLLSPTLAAKNAKPTPQIERRGLNTKVAAYTGPRFPGVAGEGTEASDHCGVFIKLRL
jgi:endonuclease/exonuclease/phosphatase family metal-dependent hydrolase